MTGAPPAAPFPRWVPTPALLIASLSRRIVLGFCLLDLLVVIVSGVVRAKLRRGIAQCEGFLGQLATSFNPELARKCSLAHTGLTVVTVVIGKCSVIGWGLCVWWVELGGG